MPDDSKPLTLNSQLSTPGSQLITHNSQLITQTWGAALLAPSLIYAPGIEAVLDAGLPLHAAAHITGGGVADNFRRVLKNGLGAVLDNLFPPLPAMHRLCEIGDIPAETAYLYWNMGNGLLLVTDPERAAELVAVLQGKGYAAQVAGQLTEAPEIVLRVGAGELRYA